MTRRGSSSALLVVVAAVTIAMVLASLSPLVLSPRQPASSPASTALHPSPTNRPASVGAAGVSSGVRPVASAALPSPSANGSANNLCCHVIANRTTGDRPAYMAVDTAANLIFISNWGSGTVTVLSGTYPFDPVPWSPVFVGGVGAYPNGEAYDPNNCTVWVTLWSLDEVWEISDGGSGPNCGGPATAGLVVAKLAMPAANQGPYDIAYDPQDQVMLVTDQGYGSSPQNVTVFCAQANPTNTACAHNGPTTVQLNSNSGGWVYPNTTLGPRYVAWDPVDDFFVATNPTGQGTSVAPKPEVDLFECTVAGACSTTSSWRFVEPAALPLGSVPSGIAYAGTGTFGSLYGGTGTFWVGDTGTNSLSVICVLGRSQYPPATPLCPTGAVIQTYGTFGVPAGTTPAGVMFYPPCNELFVTGFSANDVLVYPDQPASPPLRASVPVGVGPLAAAYDGEVVVSNYGQNATNNGAGNVSILLCSMCTSVPPCNYTVTFNETGLPVGATWYVTLNGVTMTATVGAGKGVKGGPLSGTNITFTGLCTGNYTFTVSAPSGYSATPASGVIVVPPGLAAGSEVYEWIQFSPTTPPCTYTVTFNETGLPVGTTWDVTLNGTTMTATVTASGGGMSLTFSGLCVGSYTFVVSSPAGYAATPGSGVIVVPPGLAPKSEVYEWIQFSPTTPPCNYTVTFNETGLPPGTLWDVTLNGVTMTATVTTTGGGMSLTFTGLCAGSYTFTVSSPAGYAANPASGVIVVPAGLAAGSEVYEMIMFSPTKTPCNYTVTFNETGLPVGTTWDVTLNGVTMTGTVGISASGGPSGMTLTFTGLCTGNYTFTVSAPSGYSATPASGVIVVPPGLPSGSEVYEMISFLPTTSPCTYTVTFNETGLPWGPAYWEPWDITLNGVTMSTNTVISNGLPGSTGTIITFSGLCVGSYTFTVSAPPGYTATPASGTVTVIAGTTSGSEVYVSIQFSPTTPPCTYTVTFNETGLPPGTLWDVTLNGVTMTVTVTTTGGGMSLTFTGLCAGSYSFTVSAPPGYIAAPPAGTIVVPASLAPGSEVYQPIRFTPGLCLYTATFLETGVPSGASWDIDLNGTTLTATVTPPAGTTITFSGLCAGSYGFTVSAPKGYTPDPASGHVTVPVGLPAGSEVYQVIHFQNLEFVARGLPNGTAWDVKLVGSGLPGGTLTMTSITNLISFSVPKGTYKYTISKPCFYGAKPLQGTVTVGVAVKIVPVTFYLLTKAVKFHETGLPAGAIWVVTVTGPEPTYPFAVVTTTYTEHTPTFSILTVCGNYSWNASQVASHGVLYTPTPPAGTFLIAVSGDTITKIPAANPVVIHYVP